MEARISRQRPTRLLKFLSNGEIGFADLADGDSQPYATLSHTWREDGNEITFGDLKAGTAKAKEDVYKKLKFCGDRAAQDRLKYFWVDTCCINKSDVIEVQHAINCMFRWYRNAAKCYVYLSDVAIQDETSDQISELPWESEFQRSRWFTRGWTLQELLAPQSVEFFSQHGVRLGDKRSLEHHIHARTRIPITALRGSSLSNFTVDERMSWIHGRQTKYEEDKAYSLQGIFDIFVLPNYGEGEDNAFARLREEINKRFSALQLLPVAEDAIFNSYRRQHEPTCLPDTRVGILHDIHAWADGTHERVIYWLNGLAGTGKSTIARTIARHYFEKKRLGASFFFTRGGGDVGNARKFFTTIASQLAHNVPTLNQYVCNAIAEQSNIASLSLDDQWRQLILNPLLRLAGDQSRPLFVLVIDALDECGDDSNVRLILNLLVEARRIRSVRLRIFLTSRPDVPIRHGFYQMPDAEYENLVLHNISPSIVDHDISIFLEYNLTLIRNESSFDPAWPGAETIRLLIWTASGLFIWAATACRFIHEGKQFATRRLEMILTGIKSDAGTVIAPEKHLNDIYSTVLKHSVSSEYLDEEKEELYNMLRRILGSIVTLISPLSAYSLGRLLDIPKKYVDQTLEDLHSILDVPRDQARPLRLHHPSFRDFLLDHERCEDPNFWVDEKQAHQKLADSCIRLMSTSLKQEICGIDAPGTLVADVEISRIQRCLPPEVQYACLYWIQHVQRSGIQHRDNDQVHQFLLKHLLHWLEAVTWMGKVSEAIYAIISLDSTMDVSRFAAPRRSVTNTTQVLQCPRLSEYVHDIKRFVLYHRPTIEHAPLQIYSSALIFTPSRSFVRSRFIACIPPWVRKLPKIAENWNALLQTLEGHSNLVSAIAFSPNGKLLASGSHDETVKLWEASSSTLQRTFKGHLKMVSAVAFSPDGKLLASGSHDKTVKLWDVISGTLQRTLEGHSWIVNAVAFSPDGKLLASGSHDKTVKLWDASLGTLQRTLKGHSGEVKAVAFSPDGKLLASGSIDDIVKLWDASSGTLQRTLEVDASISTLSFSNDGTVLKSNTGLLLSSLPSDNAALAIRYLPSPVFIKAQWVTDGTKNLLWLPSEYRRDHVAIHESTVAFGHSSGRVSLMNFAF
jgi:hypothetical protein